MADPRIHLQHSFDLSRPARVLVVDDDPAIIQLVRALGRRHLFEVVGAASLAEALQRAEEAPPDAVLIDLYLGPDESGLELPQRLRAIPGLETIPLGVLSGDNSFASRIAAAKAGVTVYLLKPVEPDQLAAAVHRLVAMSNPTTPNILIASANPEVTNSFSAILHGADMTVSTCAHGEALASELSKVRPDFLLIDAELPPAGAIDTCRLIRSLPRWHELYIALLIEPESDAERSALRAAGADEWLSRPANPAELIDKISTSVARINRMRERFERDSLTGLSLRRPFLEQAGTRFEESQLRGSGFSVAMIDIDHFKVINDRYGHPVGDTVLANLGRLLQTRLRPQDLRSRWGGEEFCLAFNGESAATTKAFLERLLTEFHEQVWGGKDAGDSFTVSFSAGVASAPFDGQSIEALIHRADERLYQSKREGRARIIAR